MAGQRWRAMEKLLSLLRTLFPGPRPRQDWDLQQRIQAYRPRGFASSLTSEQLEDERNEICAELADMEATALRQLAEAQENLEKIRALQKRAGCRSIRLN